MLTIKLRHLLTESDLSNDCFDLWLVHKCGKPSVEIDKGLAEVGI